MIIVQAICNTYFGALQLELQKRPASSSSSHAAVKLPHADRQPPPHLNSDPFCIVRRRLDRTLQLALLLFAG